MIARHIIVSFYIFRLLKYDKYVKVWILLETDYMIAHVVSFCIFS